MTSTRLPYKMRSFSEMIGWLSMAKPGRTGISRILHAFVYSIKGLAAAWRFEAAFRQEVYLAVVLLPIAFWVAQDTIELILLISSVFWVLMAELTNSAIEAVVDRVSSEKHVLSGRAKDIGSALVMISFILLVIIWAIIIANRYF